MKKLLSLVLALAMTMSLVTVSAGAKDFTDNSKIEYKEAVDVVSALGIVGGYEDGAFNPQNTLTRGAAAKIICNLILGTTTASALRADTAPYSDVPTTNTFAGYIAYCQKEGIISGYADGSFKPAATLTGYAFMKMLLGALGYDSDIEGYTGANWSIAVGKRALGIGLDDGNDNFVGVNAVTREEACLYAFNTLKATMVEYDAKTSVNIGGAEVTITGSAAKEVAQACYKDTMNKGNLQFAEKYFTKLSVKGTQDVFGRPANEWIYDKKSVGTFVDYTLQVGEWTEGVAGKDVYDALGSTAVKGGVEVYVDGEDENAVAKDIVKNNKKDITNSGRGVLTQAFYDKDHERAYLTFVNTYLAIADSDYNEKKDTANLTVYLDKTGDSETIKGEDFAIAKTVKEDNAFLVTYDKVNKEIVDIAEAKVISETEIEEFATKGSMTVDGEEIKRSAKAAYDDAILSAYTDGTVSNLKDTTYNVYVDAYGFYIGVEEVDAPTNYVFITAADGGSSNLSTKTLDAFAIFLDGTSKNIEVKNNDQLAEGIQINSWYTYTVSKSDVYTLTAVDGTMDVNNKATNDVAQFKDEGFNDEISKKHVSLPGAASGTYKKVYGNDDSVFLSAELDDVKKGSDTYTVISGVDNVTTGIRNVNIQAKAGTTKTEGSGANAVTYTVKAGGVYTLYKENGYIIATVVVGEDAGASKNLVYAHTDKVAREKYDKTTGMWTWTLKVILGGEEVTLTETNDTGVSVLDDMKPDTWYQVTYKADKTVKSAKALYNGATVPAGSVQFDGYVNGWGAAVDLIEADEDVVVLDDTARTYRFDLIGNTIYGALHNRNYGIFVSDDVKVVLKQTNDNKETTEYETGVKALESALKNLNEDKNGDVSYTFDAIIEDGAMTVAIITDNIDGEYKANINTKPDTTSNVAKVTIKMNGTEVLVTLLDKDGKEIKDTKTARSFQLWEFQMGANGFVMTDNSDYTWGSTKVETTAGTNSVYVVVDGVQSNTVRVAAGN